MFELNDSRITKKEVLVVVKEMRARKAAGLGGMLHEQYGVN